MEVEIPKGRYLIPNHHPIIAKNPTSALVTTIDLYYFGKSNTNNLIYLTDKYEIISITHPYQYIISYTVILGL